MQIIYGISIYLIASSFLMVSLVWLMNYRIKQSEYTEISEEDDYFSEQIQLSQNNLAA